MIFKRLNEDVIVIETGKAVALSDKLISDSPFEEVWASNSEIAIRLRRNQSEEDVHRTIQLLNERAEKNSIEYEIPICYELGLDLEWVTDFLSLPTDEIIELHLGTTYDLSYGFTPGFCYLNGMPEKLFCPRMETPRLKLPAGSVGIGGNSTGIYSLETPGGWRIIGRTPLELFNIDKDPPNLFESGAKVRFKRISKSEFENWDGGA